MKFNCGPTKEQRAKAKREAYAKRVHNLFANSGEKVFLLWPRRCTDGMCRWLETVNRYPVSVARIEYSPYGGCRSTMSTDTYGMEKIMLSDYRHEIVWKYTAL